MEITEMTLQKLYTGSLHRSDAEGLVHVKQLPLLSVVQALEGEYEIQLGQQASAHTGNGGIFIAPAGVVQTITHHVAPQTGQMRARWVFLEALVNQRFPLDSVRRFPLLVPEEKQQAFHEVLDEIFNATHPCDKMIHGYRIVKLLLEISKEKKQISSHDFSCVERLIAQRYAQKITVSDLAQCMHMSESNFHLAFKKAYGISPMAYLNRYRLSVASLLLHDASLSLQEIASGVGFYDQFYFSRCFKKAFSVSPSLYRHQLIHSEDIEH